VGDLHLTDGADLGLLGDRHGTKSWVLATQTHPEASLSGALSSVVVQPWDIRGARAEKWPPHAGQGMTDLANPPRS